MSKYGVFRGASLLESFDTVAEALGYKEDLYRNSKISATISVVPEDGSKNSVERGKPFEYRSVPRTIQAIQFLGEENLSEVREFFDASRKFDFIEKEDGYEINTLEGKFQVVKNDYIIRGTVGEYYPVKPDIFEDRYRPTRPIKK